MALKALKNLKGIERRVTSLVELTQFKHRKMNAEQAGSTPGKGRAFPPHGKAVSVSRVSPDEGRGSAWALIVNTACVPCSSSIPVSFAYLELFGVVLQAR
jgi:hypothetical protein